MALAALAGAYFARDNVIRYSLNPEQSFALLPAPFAPEYSRLDAWAVLPKEPLKRADVFFINPTLYFSGEHWNAPIDAAVVDERIKAIAAPLYAAEAVASGSTMRRAIDGASELVIGMFRASAEKL